MTLQLVAPEEILRFLLHLALHRHGYSLHRLWGWASGQDIDDELMKRGIPEELQRLFRAAFISRSDVRLPSAPSPTWVYRITQLGADHLNGAHVNIPPLSASARHRHVRPHVPRGVAVVLGVLGHVLRATEIGGNPWRSSRELTALLGSIPKLRRRGALFEHEDLQWAVRAGLAERRDPDSEGPPEYTITAAGAELNHLVWRGPQPGSGRRQLDAFPAATDRARFT